MNTYLVHYTNCQGDGFDAFSTLEKAQKQVDELGYEKAYRCQEFYQHKTYKSMKAVIVELTIQ